MEREEESDRLGVEELHHSILDVAVPMLRVPIRPGRNIFLPHRSGGAQRAPEISMQALGA